MKMVMTLTVVESGCVHYVKRHGAVLEPGCVVARLDLDDPSNIQPASHPFTNFYTILAASEMATYPLYTALGLYREQGAISDAAFNTAIIGGSLFKKYHVIRYKSHSTKK